MENYFYNFLDGRIFLKKKVFEIVCVFECFLMCCFIMNEKFYFLLNVLFVMKSFKI